MNFRAPYSNVEYMNDLELTKYFLADRLFEGSLALVLGAGVSKGLGLPEWHELVNACLAAVGLPADATRDTPNDEVMKKMDEVERKIKDNNKYKKLVHDSLYSQAKFDDTIFNQTLLSVLCTMMIGSRRGKISEVINFNFDSVLEYYLSLYGFTADVVTDFPFLNAQKDVTLYHPHGFLPYEDTSNFSEGIIFSQYSYDRRLGAKLDPWRDLTRDFFERKVCLFIGLSGSDSEIRSLLAGVDDSVKGSRPTGFWLFGSDVDTGTFLDRNVVPVRLGSHSQYPSFLLNICQIAAQKLGS